MHKIIKPIDVFVGEANDGHAELVEASLLESSIVNNLYRGRNATEMLALVRQARRECNGVTAVPPIILIDYELPEIGGVGVLRALKSAWRHRWIPVIMMTTTNHRQEAEQCRRLGCDAYVTKWAVFLGLPGFVRRIRFLADRAVWIASRRVSANWSNGYSASTLDLRSIPDFVRARHHKQERIRKEVRDGSAAS